MSGQASLVKLCSFTQAVPGCDITDPDNPVPVMLVVMVDAAGNPIPTTSTSYPVNNSGFTGDGSGFIRSYYADMAMQPVLTSVTFSTSCCGANGTTTTPTNDELVHRTIQLLGGQVLLRFGDVDETTLPVVSLSGGKLSIIWASTQTPQSLRFAGTSSDLNGNEFTIETSGGKDIANHSQADANGFWPFIQYQNRNRISSATPFEQTPEDNNDSLNIYDLPITVAGTTAVRMEGLSGDFGVFAQW